MRKSIRSICKFIVSAVVFSATIALSSCGLYGQYFQTYDDAELYLVGDCTYAAAEVSRVEIIWVGGYVEIAQSDSETLSVTETNPSPNDAEKLHYYQDGETLYLKYCQSGYRGKIDGDYKRLRVEVPENVALEVVSVAADIFAETLVVSGFDAVNVSGAVTVENLSLSASSALEIATVSGNVFIGVEAATSGEISTVSGSVTLALSGVGAVIDYSSVSGKVNSEKTCQTNDGRYTFGDGACSFEVSSVSGNLNVK